MTHLKKHPLRQNKFWIWNCFSKTSDCGKICWKTFNIGPQLAPLWVYNIIILWDHHRICGLLLTEPSLCGAWLYDPPKLSGTACSVTASYAIRLGSSALLLWVPQMLHWIIPWLGCRLGNWLLSDSIICHKTWIFSVTAVGTSDVALDNTMTRL